MSLFGPLMPDYAAGLATGVGGGGAPADTTPPTIALVSSTSLNVGGPVVVDITDLAPGLVYVAVFVTLPRSPSRVCVYRRGTFQGEFASSFAAPVTGGLRLTVYRRGGWPEGRVVFSVDAVDGAGNLA